jgi:uncharacterized protein
MFVHTHRDHSEYCQGGRVSSRPPWRITETGLDLRVRLTPRSSLDHIEGVMDTATGAAVKVWVRAAPEAGRANSAVEALVADWLAVPKTAVRVSSGVTSRVKMLTIECDGLVLARKLADWLGQKTDMTKGKL